MRKSLIACNNVTSDGFGFLIPKSRGKGYLKAPFGGEHSNDRYHAFMNEMDCDLYFDAFDVDGYLHVEFKDYRIKNQNEHLPYFENMAKLLLKLFPKHADEWEKVDRNKFFDLLDNNLKRLKP